MSLKFRVLTSFGSRNILALRTFQVKKVWCYYLAWHNKEEKRTLNYQATTCSKSNKVALSLLHRKIKRNIYCIETKVVMQTSETKCKRTSMRAAKKLDGWYTYKTKEHKISLPERAVQQVKVKNCLLLMWSTTMQRLKAIDHSNKSISSTLETFTVEKDVFWNRGSKQLNRWRLLCPISFQILLTYWIILLYYLLWYQYIILRNGRITIDCFHILL